MSGPFHIRMDDAAFADMPNKVVPRTVRLKDPALESPDATAFIFSGYREKLLYKNEQLLELLQQFEGRVEDPECWDRLTLGQQVLYSLGALDDQVKNGGLTQFFWNCPDLISPANDAMVALGATELVAAYDKAVESLIGNKDEWIELRNQAGENPGNFLESFQATYDLLDLTWFDDAYFDEHGPLLLTQLVQYVRANKADFIQS